jgi:ribosomal-protein-alanine N-acetyltransferase
LGPEYPNLRGLTIYKMYIIQTSRLGLRNWKDSDTSLFIEMNMDDTVMEFFPALQLREETLAMIERNKRTIVENNLGLWAAELKQTKEFIGFVGLSIPRFAIDFTPCVEIGWRLAPAYWGYGYATEAATSCLDYGFNQLKLGEILSFASALNLKSINVMKKIGMDYVKDFEHPCVDESRLKTHVLYMKKAEL